MLAEGDLWDIKYPMMLIPHAAMHAKPVKSAVMKLAAELVGWQMRIAQTGTWPTLGFYGEALDPLSTRGKRAGERLAGSFRAAFAGCKADGKAR
eukprot:5664515-Alexandrium_andersonii.AAC.1